MVPPSTWQLTAAHGQTTTPQLGLDQQNLFTPPSPDTGAHLARSRETGEPDSSALLADEFGTLLEGDRAWIKSADEASEPRPAGQQKAGKTHQGGR